MNQGKALEAYPSGVRKELIYRYHQAALPQALSEPDTTSNYTTLRFEFGLRNRLIYPLPLRPPAQSNHRTSSSSRSPERLPDEANEYGQKGERGQQRGQMSGPRRSGDRLKGGDFHGSRTASCGGVRAIIGRAVDLMVMPVALDVGYGLTVVCVVKVCIGSASS